MQFQAFEKGIEVNGQTVWSIVAGFKVYKKLPVKFLLEQGIGEPTDDGFVRIDPDGWFPQEAWLRAFERIASDVGEMSLFQIGQKIPENAKFPDWVDGIEKAIASIDVAYHMNHRKAGTVMFDPGAGTMTEGIGHYGFERVTGQNLIVSKCENPYPCQFDLGIVTAMAKRFEPMSRTRHDDSAPCRRRGDRSCTYRVEW